MLWVQIYYTWNVISRDFAQPDLTQDILFVHLKQLFYYTIPLTL